MYDTAKVLEFLTPREISDAELPVRLERAEQDKLKKSVLSGIAQRANRQVRNNVEFYHRTVNELVATAADVRLLRRQFRMTQKEIVAELIVLGVEGFGINLKFPYRGAELTIKYYPMDVSSLNKLEALYGGLIRPMEVKSNGRVVVAPVIGETLVKSLSTALLATGQDLTLDESGIGSALNTAVTTRALPSGKAEDILKNLHKASAIIDTGQKVVFDKGEYKKLDATPKEVSKATERVETLTGELMDILTLSEADMVAQVEAAAKERSKKAALAKRHREIGEWAAPILDAFGVDGAEGLRTILTNYVNSLPDIPADEPEVERVAN